MEPPFDKDTLIEKFIEYDNDVNSGRGFSESPDSGILGWKESRFLHSYFIMYEATEDRRWLDKLVEHFDRVIANMADHDGDGYPTWHTPTFSTAEVLTRKLHNRGTAEILPSSASLENLCRGKKPPYFTLDTPIVERIRDIEKGEQIGDKEYVLEFTKKDRFVIRDLANWITVYESDYAPGKEIGFAPGFSVKIEGNPEIGDKFRIECRSIRTLGYLVHQGMFLYPVSLFMEAVVKDKALRDEFADKVKEYLDLIENVIIPKNERYWMDMTDHSGAYRVCESRTERYPNKILPHNQYLAMARTYFVLKEVSPNPFYLDRTLKMGRYFKDNLHEIGDAYTWHYWDWIEEGEFYHGHVEDTGHGTIDVGFAVECCRRGVLFDDSELLRFCKTFSGHMWNGSLENPKIGERVDTKEGDAKPFIGWINLAQWDPRIFDICYAIFVSLGEPATFAPYILQGWSRKVEGLSRA